MDIRKIMKSSILLVCSLFSLVLPESALAQDQNDMHKYPGKIQSSAFDSSHLININADNVPLKLVLEEIKRQTGEKIICESSIAERKITIVLQQIPFWQCLQGICDISNAHFDIQEQEFEGEIKILDKRASRLIFYGGPYIAWTDVDFMLRGEILQPFVIAWQHNIWPSSLETQLPNFEIAHFAITTRQKSFSKKAFVRGLSRRHILLDVENLLVIPNSEGNVAIGIEIKFALPGKSEIIEIAPVAFEELYTRKLSNGVDIYCQITPKAGPLNNLYCRFEVGLMSSNKERGESHTVDAEVVWRPYFSFFQPPTVKIVDDMEKIRRISFQGAPCLTVAETWVCYGYLFGSVPLLGESSIQKATIAFAMNLIAESIHLECNRIGQLFPQSVIAHAREQYFHRLMSDNHKDLILNTIEEFNDIELLPYVEKYLVHENLERETISRAISVISLLKSTPKEKICFSLLAHENQLVVIIAGSEIATIYPAEVGELFERLLKEELMRGKVTKAEDYVRILGRTKSERSLPLFRECLDIFPNWQPLWLCVCEALSNIPGKKSRDLLCEIIQRLEIMRRKSYSMYGVKELAEEILKKIDGEKQ